MFVHFDSTAIHVIELKTDSRPEYQILKANGLFLNFANEPIYVHFEVYVPRNNPDWRATSIFAVDDIVELSGTIINLKDDIITVRPFKCHISKKVVTNIPRAQSWLRAIGTLKSTTQIRNNITTFTVQTSQYVSGSGPTIQFAEFDIQIHHNVERKNLQERTTKAKLGSKVSIIGELDIYNNKLCVELHNFDFLSLNIPQTTSIQQPFRNPTSTNSSQKRSLMYESLFEKAPAPPNQSRKRNRSDNPASSILEKQTSPNDRDTDSLSTIPSDQESNVEEGSSKPKGKPIKQEKRQLRSNPPKKIANIASTKLTLPPHSES